MIAKKYYILITVSFICFRTTTDGAANFQKAFAKFGLDLDDQQEVAARASEPVDAQLEDLIADPPEAQESPELEVCTV